MHPDSTQEPVFKRQQIQEYMVVRPGQSANHRPSHRIENEVVCSSNDGNEDDERIEGACEDTRGPSDIGNRNVYTGPEDTECFRLLLVSSNGNGNNCQPNEEGVTEVEGWHGGCARSQYQSIAAIDGPQFCLGRSGTYHTDCRICSASIHFLHHRHRAPCQRNHNSLPTLHLDPLRSCHSTGVVACTATT